MHHGLVVEAEPVTSWLEVLLFSATSLVRWTVFGTRLSHEFEGQPAANKAGRVCVRAHDKKSNFDRIMPLLAWKSKVLAVGRNTFSMALAHAMVFYSRNLVLTKDGIFAPTMLCLAWQPRGKHSRRHYPPPYSPAWNEQCASKLKTRRFVLNSAKASTNCCIFKP